MKFRAVYAVVAILSVTFFSSEMSGQSKNFKAGKSLEVQTMILRTLQEHYVDSIDVEKLVNSGVVSMLKGLDPYTEYIPEENEENIDMMTTGSYGGVGSIIKKLPTGEIQISEPYEGSPSHKSGLKPGDMILEINGESTQEMSNSDASSKMRGEPGTELKLKVKKGRGGAVEDVVLIRERIHVPDVVYAGMIQDTIGYISIGSFTMYGAKDVKEAFLKLKEGGKMERLIIDLRGNGGGLMSEAVEIVSLFVPKGTSVVSSRGKNGEMIKDYKTTSEPVDTEIPIMVLVNSSSASSSEIVAGALQDLDRAVIAGVRTFGKGLVQNILPVGYDNSLKLTIAKYYTPSGRCVQAIDYSHRNKDGSVGYVPDSLKQEFKTKNGRSVYDGGGIAPDIEVETEYLSRPVVALIYGDILGDYAVEYFNKNEKIASPSQFLLTENEYQEFVKFAATKEFDHRNEAQIEMARVVEGAKRDGIYERVKETMDKLVDEVDYSKEEIMQMYKDDIKSALENEICVKYYFQRGGAESNIRYDNQLKRCVERWDDSILVP